MHLVAAEAATEAADRHRRAHSARAAAAAANWAAELITRCEGARTPALLTAPVVVPLTEREREVGMLAAGGLTSREIATRLFLSARTVENHLQRVYSKLGVTSRAELAATLSTSARAERPG
jgi:DNA-binding NarL/FixJ family response regulator